MKGRLNPVVLLGILSAILLAGAGGGIVWYWRQRSVPSITETPSLLKIIAREPGFYQISAYDLSKLDKQFPLNRDSIQLSNGYIPQPFWLEGNGAALKLRFYVPTSSNIYSRDSIFWLSLGENAENYPEMNQVHQLENAIDDPSLWSEPQKTMPDEAIWSVVHLEEDNLYTPLVEQGEHWFWSMLPAPQDQRLNFTLPGVGTGPGCLEIQVWASTEAASNPDHHLIVYLNDVMVVDERWDGKGWHTLKVDVAPGILRTSQNQFRLVMPGDTGAPADTIYLNWIDVGYPRQSVAQDDRLEFTFSGKSLQLIGFTNPIDLYDLTMSGKPEMTGSYSDPVIQVDRSGWRRYQAIGSTGYRQPERILVPTSMGELKSPGLGVDYLVIGPSDLLVPLQPLLDWRQEQGLKVLAVPVDTIYDEFGAGYPDPQSIRAFLKYSILHWQPVPRFVLLVGDASYDPKGFMGISQANRLPTFFVQTIFGGETSSDLGFAELTGNNWTGDSVSNINPAIQLAVGRIPAQNVSQVATMVRKILNYEKTPAQDWQQRILAVTDVQEPRFQEDADAFLEVLKDHYEVELIYPETYPVEPNLTIQQRINQGNLLVVYFGHGSLKMWGKSRLLSTDDVSGLTNGDRLPIMLHLTCLTGLFTHPKIESLAESLLWRENGGAVAVLAPTSLTLPDNQSYLSLGLANALLANPGGTIGEILKQARAGMPRGGSGTQDVLNTFLLFGDPAMKLPGLP